MPTASPQVLVAVLATTRPTARLEPHDGALRFSQVVLSAGGSCSLELTLASNSNLAYSGLFGAGIGQGV